MSTTFSPAALKQEQSETGANNIHVAKVLRVDVTYLSMWRNGTRKPSDDVQRDLGVMFTVIRAERMAHDGSFAFNAKGIRLLQRAIAEARKSIVRSTRATNRDATAEGNQACAN